jgi:hypothetical protein
MKTVVFVVSCEKTVDVLEHFFLGFQLYCKNVDFPIYVGCNHVPSDSKFSGIQFISAPKSNWKDETIFQLKALKIENPNVSNVILILDDFIIKKNLDFERLKSIVEFVENNQLKYLRIKRLEGSIINLFSQYLRKIPINKDDNIFEIPKSHPYYSSLQIAIWEYDYLISSLQKCKNIWDFELQSDSLFNHYSIYKDVFSYRHIVEKGKWEIYAKSYCEKYIGFFNVGERSTRNVNLLGSVYNMLRRLKFMFLGYLFSRKFKL